MPSSTSILLCMQEGKALVRLHLCAGTPEWSGLADAIRTKVLCAGLYIHWCLYDRKLYDNEINYEQ